MEKKVIVRFDWIDKKLSFNGEENLQRVISSMNNIYFNTTDENGNSLPEEEWTLVEDNGHVLLTGRKELEAEVGVLDSDGNYDTTYCKYIEDCSERELDLIQKELEYDYMSLSDELKNYIARERNIYIFWGFNRLDGHKVHIAFYGSKGIIVDIDNAMTTDDAERFIKSQIEDENDGIISQSEIDKIVDVLDRYGYIE